MTAVAAPRLPGHLPSTGDVGVNELLISFRMCHYYKVSPNNIVWLELTLKKTITMILQPFK